MRLGALLDWPAGAPAEEILERARTMERQGFATLWLGDHLLDTAGEDTPDGPLESLTLMTAIGAVTERIRLGWSTLNPAFRPPAVLAKMLATLDHITHGRVICSLGSGWLESEYTAYDLPFLDHDGRAAYAREVAELLKELWTHPAPERVTFNGRFVKTKDLPFNPAPYQTPHPPIWIGGDSDATIETVKAVADGWITITSATQERLAELRAQPDWPERPLTIVKMAQVAVAPDEGEAIAEARGLWEDLSRRLKRRSVGSFESFLEGAVVGTPEQCLARLREWEGWGVDELYCIFRGAGHQERVACLLLPALRGKAAQPV